jgi:hypothetical protein
MIAGATLSLLGGCIVSDEITTLTILPDGSASWVKFQSNIHSSETGAKGAEELKRFVEEFEAHKDTDYQNIRRAGGEVLEARWVRREEPYAKLMVARLPSASSLRDFCTIKGEKGEVIAQPRFTQSGKRRRFSVEIQASKDERPAEAKRPTTHELRQAEANGISETRIAVAGGQIVASRGFTVAADKRSALLEPVEIQGLLEAGREKVELFLEWDLSDN